MNFQKLFRWMFRVANYDFCPSVNWLVMWLKEPIGWVVTAIVFSLLVGLLVGPQGYLLALSFFTLLVLGLVWPWLSMKGVRCRLVLPDRRVAESQELEVVFRVKNYWPLPIFGLIVRGDFLQESAAEEEVAFSLKRVGAWSESEFRIKLTPRRRGKFPAGQVSVVNGFPFGLVEITKAVDLDRSTIVWPECKPLEGLPVSNASRFRLQGALHDKAGNEGDSIGVRVYRTGDRLRNIHWAQSARSQKLMVRERQSVASTGAMVVLDLSPGDHEGLGGSSSFEWTIRIAASICSHLHETHSPVQVFCCGLSDQNRHEDNRNGLRPVMDFLAKLPTLAYALKNPAALETRQNRVSDLGLFSGSGHVFVIGSSRSIRMRTVGSHNLASNITPVVLDIAGFETRDSFMLFDNIAVEQQSSEHRLRAGASILIETPKFAAEALANGWNRSFRDAV